MLYLRGCFQRREREGGRVERERGKEKETGGEKERESKNEGGKRITVTVRTFCCKAFHAYQQSGVNILLFSHSKSSDLYGLLQVSHQSHSFEFTCTLGDFWQGVPLVSV